MVDVIEKPRCDCCAPEPGVKLATQSELESVRAQRALMSVGMLAACVRALQYCIQFCPANSRRANLCQMERIVVAMCLSAAGRIRIPSRVFPSPTFWKWLGRVAGSRADGRAYKPGRGGALRA
jgi:hypothetical protein